MKHIKSINETYKPATEFDENWPGLKIPVKNFVDYVFDGVQDIICQVEGISEKSFKQLDANKKYVEEVFDNTPEILVDIDRLNDKRYQYVAEYIYDKYFTQKKEVIDYENRKI
jgi:hypothetical protein